MSGIYKKTVTLTYEADFIKCDKCGVEAQFSHTIDSWIAKDGDNYCLYCQREHEIGFFEKNKK